jgi:signal transduction histidine kinase
LKRKLFWIIFFLLVAFTAVVFTFDRLYFFNQFNENIESELETIASTIIASNLSVDVLTKFESTDDIVRDLLEHQRLDRSIRIFDLHGELVFSNELAQNITGSYSKQTWSEIVVDNHQLKRLTINAGEYILEVGIFVDSKIKRAKDQLNRILFVMCIALLLALLLAFIASEMLVRPLNKLSAFFVTYNLKDHLRDASEKTITENTEALRRLTHNEDEVSALARSLLSLLDKNAQERDRKDKDLYFLAHELKTPLSHIVIGLESLKLNEINPAQQEKFDRLLLICKNLSIFIKDYLRIAAIRFASKDQLQVSALKLEKTIQNIYDQLKIEDKSRVRVEIKNDLTVAAEPHHLESLIVNLISNALKYSDKEVDVRLESNTLTVTDLGPGFSEKSLANMGQPFNRSGAEGSSGLGLTYCFEICKLYEWSLNHERKDDKTSLRVEFNRDSI